MTKQLVYKIRSSDLADFTSGDPKRKQRFVNDLDTAFQSISFVANRNYGLMY